MKLKCERCSNEWMAKTEKLPKSCPSCRSIYWQKPISEYWKQVRENNKVKKALNEETDTE